ncbi:hypothetical protein KIN20_032222 [Parelaphostrongylus tenuis]|uniref:Uncharacterized protein n=1 Tax=Parelaphostrongylus tenuis TaxID=148309 RepID=A0AAD5WIC4_PARTN|nr:hypothetical protein KIN20_032222 [Parelaphostrongylus tenuis]
MGHHSDSLEADAELETPYQVKINFGWYESGREKSKPLESDVSKFADNRRLFRGVKTMKNPTPMYHTKTLKRNLTSNLPAISQLEISGMISSSSGNSIYKFDIGLQGMI